MIQIINMEVITIKTKLLKFITVLSVVAVLCVAITICIITADKQSEGTKIVFIKNSITRRIYR